MIPLEKTLLQPPPWKAELSLEFEARGGETLLTGRQHFGPLRVQKALYPEGRDVCQVIVLHPPAGIAGGDQLHIEARVGDAAHAQITTPGAGKWYRSAGPESMQEISFHVGQQATLEWLPQETIFFDGTHARMSSRIHLAADANFLGWEILCLGRTAANEHFDVGQLFLDTRIEREGKPLWLERGQISGGDPMRQSAAGWKGRSVCATFLIASPHVSTELLAACRSHLPTEEAADHALTCLPGLIIGRYLGHSSEAARHWLSAIWHSIRPTICGRPAMLPRIWNT